MSVNSVAPAVQRLITPKEVSALIRATPGTLAVWRSTRRYSLPFVRIGSKILYKLSDVEKFIECRTVGASTDNPPPKRRRGRPARKIAA